MKTIFVVYYIADDGEERHKCIDKAFLTNDAAFAYVETQQKKYGTGDVFEIEYFVKIIELVEA